MMMATEVLLRVTLSRGLPRALVRLGRAVGALALAVPTLLSAAASSSAVTAADPVGRVGAASSAPLAELRAPGGDGAVSVASVAEAGVGAGRAAPVAITGEALRADLESMLQSPRFAGAQWGVSVVSLATGEMIFAHGAERRMSPASNTKLFTAALVLDRLGGASRLQTRILATRAADAAGVLRGDLVIAGRGDPGWNPRRTGQSWADMFAPMVDILRRAGVRRITGDVIADGTYLRVPPHGASWTADDLMEDYGAEVSGVVLDENYVEFDVAPASEVGASATLVWRQPEHGLTLDNRVVTGAGGGAPSLRVVRVAGETVVRVFGTIPLGAKPRTLEATVPRPAEWYASELVAALRAAGIGVEGKPRGVRWPETPEEPRATVTLGVVESAPVRELVRVMMKDSNNLRASLLFDLAGELTRLPETPVWRTSEELGAADLQAFLRERGIPGTEAILEEGSGLSRNNLVSPAVIVALLQRMAEHREVAAWIDSLPVAGVDGSLRSRFRGGPAEGRVWAKTGTLRWAHSLSGYVDTVGGARLAFSVMLNRHRVEPGAPEARAELDALVERLVAYGGR
jgi:D-alanyl-D-alanine carboxypeptidase/D-alanyl-D-alanine-endopeptidase (penicillin-binding protein 4)